MYSTEEKGFIKARELFKDGYFHSYSEFLLALSIARMLKEKGYILDLSDMTIEKDMVNEGTMEYFKIVLALGCIYLGEGVEVPQLDEEEEKRVLDISYFNDIPLYYKEDGVLYWDLEWARENYGDYIRKFFNLNEMGNMLLHVIAKYLVDSILGSESAKKLVLKIDSRLVKSTFVYVNIYSCKETLGWFNECIDLDIDFENLKVDLDFSIFCNNGFMSGRHKYYSVDEKHELLKKYGIQEGSIILLWRRSGMCQNNVFGKIDSSIVARVDEILENSIYVTTIAVNKTKEEVRQDYYDINEEYRYLFMDILDKKPYVDCRELELYTLGIENHFLDEEEFITVLDVTEKVEKMITINGEVRLLEISGVDAIYWLLSQYEVDFDRDLFKSMYYPKDKEPLWDMYN